jgi:hypothetical protein
MEHIRGPGDQVTFVVSVWTYHHVPLNIIQIHKEREKFLNIKIQIMQHNFYVYKGHQTTFLVLSIVLFFRLF